MVSNKIFYTGKMSGFVRFILCFFRMTHKYQVHIPHVHTFDHFIYVDYVTTSKNAVTTSKPVYLTFLLPHQNEMPYAIFHT